MSTAHVQPIKPTSPQVATVFNSFSANIGQKPTAEHSSETYSTSVNTSIFIKITWSPEDPIEYYDY